MKMTLIVLVTLELVACGVQTYSTPESSAVDNLARKLKSLPCVERVDHEQLANNTPTDNLYFKVKNIQTMGECVASVEKAVPGITFFSASEDLGFVLILSDTKQIAVINKVKAADCAKSIEPDLLINTLHRVAPKTTGKILLVVKEGVAASDCANRLRANGVIIDQNLGSGLLMIKGR